MKPAILALSVFLLLPAAPARAHPHHHLCLVGPCCGGGSPAHWARRSSPAAARFAITNDNRSVDLLLDRREVILQLSDRMMNRVSRDLRDERDEDDGFFLAAVIKNAVLDGVRDMLDHSLRCPLSELRDVQYRDGRLVFVTRDGDELFDHLDVEDRDVMETFSPADARAFVAEFRRLKGARG